MSQLRHPILHADSMHVDNIEIIRSKVIVSFLDFEFDCFFGVKWDIVVPYGWEKQI